MNDKHVLCTLNILGGTHPSTLPILINFESMQHRHMILSAKSDESALLTGEILPTREEPNP